VGGLIDVWQCIQPRSTLQDAWGEAGR
jgi:hypothetical protein